jgi:hypothetical protein
LARSSDVSRLRPVTKAATAELEIAAAIMTKSVRSFGNFTAARYDLVIRSRASVCAKQACFCVKTTLPKFNFRLDCAGLDRDRPNTIC